VPQGKADGDHVERGIAEGEMLAARFDERKVCLFAADDQHADGGIKADDVVRVAGDRDSRACDDAGSGGDV